MLINLVALESNSLMERGVVWLGPLSSAAHHRPGPEVVQHLREKHGAEFPGADQGHA